MIDLRSSWFVGSALWIASVFYVESLDGLLLKELGEVLTTAFIPPVLPPLALAVLVRVLAGMYRP
jgi:hypothetical protein